MIFKIATLLLLVAAAAIYTFADLWETFCENRRREALRRFSWVPETQKPDSWDKE